MNRHRTKRLQTPSSSTSISAASAAALSAASAFSAATAALALALSSATFAARRASLCCLLDSGAVSTHVTSSTPSLVHALQTINALPPLTYPSSRSPPVPSGAQPSAYSCAAEHSSGFAPSFAVSSGPPSFHAQRPRATCGLELWAPAASSRRTLRTAPVTWCADGRGRGGSARMGDWGCCGTACFRDSVSMSVAAGKVFSFFSFFFLFFFLCNRVTTVTSCQVTMPSDLV